MEYIKSWGLSLLAALGLAQPAPEYDASQPLKIGSTEITIVQGDITKQKVDAIVNAANENLKHGGGVARAISRAAGPKMQQYCDAMSNYEQSPDRDPHAKKSKTWSYQKCPVGKAVITPAFDLEKVGIKKVVHATGPRGNNPDKEQLLRDAYQNSLRVAHKNGLKSVAFPAISTAIFGYDINEATPVAFAAVRDWVKKHPNALDEVRFVLFSDEDLAVYQKYAGELLK